LLVNRYQTWVDNIVGYMVVKVSCRLLDKEWLRVVKGWLVKKNLGWLTGDYYSATKYNGNLLVSR
jgi:hypothetical protein